MPDKPSAGPRGVFIASERQAARDEEVATDMARHVQLVDDPRTGAVFLSIVNRLSTLEAAVRAERLLRLGAEARQEILVLDNEEATAKIALLQEEIGNLNAQLDEVAEVIPESERFQTCRDSYLELFGNGQRVITEYRVLEAELRVRTDFAGLVADLDVLAALVEQGFATFPGTR